MTPDALLSSVPAQIHARLETDRRVSPDRGADLLRSFAKMQRMWLDYEIPMSNLSSISTPTLVIAGDRDMITVAHTVKMCVRDSWRTTLHRPGC